MVILAIVFQVLLGLAFLAAGGGKLASAKQSVAQRDTLRVVPWFWSMTGALEVLGALGVLIGIFVPALAALAAIGLALAMVGAVVVHFRANQPLALNIPSLVLFALAVTVAAVRWVDLTHFKF
ncbi:MAG: DoxX family protein [Ktedonobacterales bacterium]|nr:DoxX family protein [Ktedonobacterales bacterium]